MGSVCCCSLTIVLQWAVCAVKCSLTICYTFYINYSSMPGGLEYRMIVSMILSILAEIDLYNIYLPINLPTYPSTHSSIHLPTYPSIHLLIHSSTHPSTHSSIHLPTYPSSIYPPTHPPTHLSICPLIHHLSIHPPIHPLIYPSAHLSIHPSIYPLIHPPTHTSTLHPPTQLFI